MMKATGALGLLFLILISCQNDSVDPVETGTNPVKVTHYDLATGDLLVEIVYEYSDGKLVREIVTDKAEGRDNAEINYEFDANGYLINRREYLEVFNLTKLNYYSYAGDLLSKDSSVYEHNPQLWSNKLFFYGDDRFIDSVQLFQPMIGNDGLYAGTYLYSYDASKRMTLERYTLNNGSEPATISEYTYTNNKITRCAEGNCFYTELNDAGQVIKYTMNERLMEEFFYKDNLLTEKKLYRYETYDAGNTPTGVTLVKYKY